MQHQVHSFLLFCQIITNQNCKSFSQSLTIKLSMLKSEGTLSTHYDLITTRSQVILFRGYTCDILKLFIILTF